jgi:hypothetical protein
VNHRPSPPRMTDEQIRQLLAAEQGGAKPDCFLCGMPVTVLRATLEIGKEEETRVVTMYPCEHRWSYNVRVAEQIDGQMRAAAATEATNGPAELAGENPAADALAAELHRRAVRLEELRPFRAPTCLGCPAVQVDGEVIGLMGALGIVLGGQVPGGTADELGKAYYQSWIVRQGVR